MHVITMIISYKDIINAETFVTDDDENVSSTRSQTADDSSLVHGYA